MSAESALLAISIDIAFFMMGRTRNWVLLPGKIPWAPSVSFPILSAFKRSIWKSTLSDVNAAHELIPCSGVILKRGERGPGRYSHAKGNAKI